jgi:hypothetical protein
MRLLAEPPASATRCITGYGPTNTNYVEDAAPSTNKLARNKFQNGRRYTTASSIDFGALIPQTLL